MAALPLYQQISHSSGAALRADVMQSLAVLFPQYRSMPKTPALYTDEESEIFFITDANALVYIRIALAGTLPGIDELLDDYYAVAERWGRLQKRNGEMPGGTEAPVALVVMTDRLPDNDLRKLRSLRSFPLTVYEVNLMQGNDERLAYCYTVKYAYAGDYISAPMAEPMTGKAASVSLQEELQAEEDIIQTVCQATIAERRDAAQEKSPMPDFFERAQLNEEEEREFFLLNKKLSEAVSGTEVT